jgi:uncharacterized protein
MVTEFLARVAFAPAALWVALSAQAQLSSPMPGIAPVQKKSTPASPASAGPATGLPAGAGPGVHSPDSPFAPLPQRTDVVPWSVLTSVTTRTDRNRVLPVFNAGQLALHQKTQRIQGFMMPLEPGEKQSHFLLSSVPLTCSFCTPGGPESMVEVKTKTPVRATMEPVVVEGRFLVLNDDPYGLYYRITEAVGVK